MNWVQFKVHSFKKELSSVQKFKNELFSSLKNISKGSMPKSGPINNLEVFLWDNVLNIINFLGKSLEFFYLQQNSNGISIFWSKLCQETFVFMIEKWTELFCSF